jgi:pimeloyl-ACP methyl ester carboxylesterase
MNGLEHSCIQTNGVKLHVVRAGPEDGPLVILLHGFPEYWGGWRNQIPALVKAGYRVVAPDQRGYGSSDKPKAVSAYDVDVLTRDIIGLMDHEGREKAYLVGHDWGAVVAWWAGIHYPDRLEKLAILNVPHPSVMQSNLRNNWRQIRKSWYAFFFQLPVLPERAFTYDGGQAMLDSLQKTANPGSFSDEDLADYAEVWANKGAPTAMINWYRAAGRRLFKRGDKAKVDVSTLMIWGEGDAFLGKEMAAPSIKYCSTGRLEMIPNATHWVQHDAAEQVNQLLLTFFAE